MEVLARTPRTLSAIVDRHAPEALRARPSEGRWSPNEIVGHLVDSEWVYGYRSRRILSEDTPAILGTNQEAWVARQRHNERDPFELVAEFRAMRQFNLALWGRLSSADWKREGRHDERGAESLEVVLRMTAGHDLSHLDQITRGLETSRARP
jgi:hypothetical protein